VCLHLWFDLDYGFVPFLLLTFCGDINVPSQPFLKVQFSGMKYLHTVEQSRANFLSSTWILHEQPAVSLDEEPWS
jgi:hypothetical protein